jgi:hypothetical protein
MIRRTKMATAIAFAAAIAAFQPLSAATSTTYTHSGGVLTLSNTLLELKWNGSNGTIIGLRNKVTGTQHIGGSVFANWTAFVNTTTSDKWKASLGTMIKGRTALLSSATTTTTATSVTLHLRFDRVGGKYITITQRVTLYDNDPISHWTTDVTNNEPNSTVTAVVTPQLTGVNVLSDEALAWPFNEGEIYVNPGTRFRFMQYPVPASMQWMQLYNSREGLYYAVLDTKAHFKEFRFGYDGGLDPAATSPRQMSGTVWPFASTGMTYSSPPVDIGVMNEGGWYSGADRYRYWLINVARWEKGKPAMAATLDAWYPRIMKFYGQSNTMPYREVPNLLRSLNSYGVHNLELLGWHVDGFDSYYPDYKTLPSAGGDAELRNAIAASHAAGDRVFFYINNHIADVGSAWYAANAGVANARKVNGSFFPESYGNGRSFYAMSPSSTVWINQLRDRTRFLRDLGADGIWWDQMAEMPAVLDYNRAAGHFSPATGFAEGYKKMMDAIHWSFSYEGRNTNYVFAMEGVNDYYSYYVDINGMMWQRNLGYAPQQAPQLTRYTIPARFLGLPTVGKPRGSIDQYAWAFTLGNPLLVDGTNSNVFPRYLNVYKAEPEIYFYGVYKDERGLGISNPSIRGTSIVARGNGRLGLQLRNVSGVSQSGTITLNYGAIGLGGKFVNSVQNIEGGANVSFTRGTNSVSFPVTVPAGDVRAFRVVF